MGVNPSTHKVILPPPTQSLTTALTSQIGLQNKVKELPMRHPHFGPDPYAQLY